ncbi:MAG: GrpB family protein [Nocardiopsaceae bacterium]|nr:GrpB family protein [Nocardiopsaceae bacterium]
MSRHPTHPPPRQPRTAPPSPSPSPSPAPPPSLPLPPPAALALGGSVAARRAGSDDGRVNASPAWAYEKVELVRYDPRWPEVAARELARVNAALGPWLAAPAEHVGSTSIPGLAAKPVIDLMAAVRDLDAVIVTIVAELDRVGWVQVPPELDTGASWRRFFVLPDAAGRRRVAHLHVMSPEQPRWQELPAFRDALRADAALARSYEAHKRRLAAKFADDREAYTAAKSSFVAHVLRATG